MPLILTPGQLGRRADFYYQMGQLTSAGLGVIAALDHLRRAPPARSYAEPIRTMLERLSQGYTFTEAARHTGTWMPAFDTALLQAGEQSGRLDACFRLLADYYRDRARLARQILADLAYPAFLFHFAIFIFPFSAFFASGDWKAYLLHTFGVLVPIYALIFGVVYATQSRRGERWRTLLEFWLNGVPMLGTARRSLALARLAAALEALLSAGVTIIEAWQLAAAACGSPALLLTVMGWKTNLLSGSTPAEMVNNSHRFPEMFASQYATGEISGTLDETLRRLQTYYHEDGSRRMHLLAQWTPRAVYLLVALLIAYKVISFYAGWFKQIGDASHF